MKRLLLALTLLVLLCPVLYSQSGTGGGSAPATVITNQKTFTTATSGKVVDLRGTGVYNHAITWTGTGTRTTCTIKLEQSADNVTYSDLIAGQVCTSNNTATATGYVNYVRMTVTAITGTGNTIYARYDGVPVQASVGTVTMAPGAAVTANAGTNLNTSALATESTLSTKLNGGLPAALAGGGGLKVEGVAGGVAVPVSAASLPLPSGAATSALQGAGLPAALAGDGGLKITAATQDAAEGATATTNPVPIAGLDASSKISIPRLDSNHYLYVSQGTATNLKTQAENYQGGSAVAAGNGLYVQPGTAAVFTSDLTKWGSVTVAGAGTTDAAGTEAAPYFRMIPNMTLNTPMNLGQIGGVAVGAANGMYVRPGTSATWAVTQGTGDATSPWSIVAPNTADTPVKFGDAVNNAVRVNIVAGVTTDIAEGTGAGSTPALVGGIGVTTEKAAVDTGDSVRFTLGVDGGVVAHLGALPQDHWQANDGGTQVTDTTAVVVIAHTDNYFTVVTNMTITNSDATVGTWVQIIQGTGSVCGTGPSVLWTGYAASLGGGWTLANADGIFSTTAHSNDICIKAITTSSETGWSLSGYKTLLDRVSN